jgi:hypothetical protein
MFRALHQPSKQLPQDQVSAQKAVDSSQIAFRPLGSSQFESPFPMD